ncbi:hypothetical protein BGW39_000269, partial [Mortierella sp. 14UC]
MDTGERLRQPTMGPHLTMPGESTEGAVAIHSGDPSLAVSDMVPDSEEPGTSSTTPDPTAGSSRLFCRWESAGLDTCSLAYQRQWLTEEGASAATVKVMTESTLAKTRKRHYKGPQAQWILHCSGSSIDPFNPTAVELLNFLASGQPEHNAVERFTNTPVDIVPVLDHFRTMGPNSDLKPSQPFSKLCWLLAVCGFMRPSDIHRVDVSHSLVLPSGELELQVAGPKEKRAGQHIIKSVFIRLHEDPLVCLVATYQCYAAQLASFTLISVKHPFFGPDLQSFDSTIFDFNLSASTVTIGHRIAKVSDLLPLPPGMGKVPSGRSLGSSLVIKHGASSGEVRAQGFWAHSATYESFYRLSRRFIKNLAQVTLTGWIAG